MYESVAKLPCGKVTVAKLPCGEVTGNQSGNQLFAQGRRIQQLAVSQCFDLSTAAGISANCFHCSCRFYASAACGLDRSIITVIAGKI